MKLRLVLAAGAGVAALLLAPLPAVADEPLPTPTNLVAQHVSDTAADLTWLGSALTAGDVVQRNVNGTWQTYATGRYSFLPLTNLSPATTYTFRVYSPAEPGLGYTTSGPSAPVSFTTLSGPDSVPPAKPATPTFNTVTITQATVFWPETTDNVQVTGYHLQQLIGGSWTTIRTVTPAQRFQTVYGLAANTAYSFAVIAFDARGNTSARSDPGTVTTLPYTPTPTCQFQIIPFPPGFQAVVTITNTTAATMNGWTVRFTLPATATVNYAFNGVLSRDGATGTISPQPWNTVIGQGVQFFTGIVGSATPFTPPSGFTLNGEACTARF
jgi:Cellulose binding domain